MHYGGSAHLGWAQWGGTAGVTARRYSTAKYAPGGETFYQGHAGVAYRVRQMEITGEVRMPFGRDDSRSIVDRSLLLRLLYFLE